MIDEEVAVQTTAGILERTCLPVFTCMSQRDAIAEQVDTIRNKREKPLKAHTQARYVVPTTQANIATQAANCVSL